MIKKIIVVSTFSFLTSFAFAEPAPVVDYSSDIDSPKPYIAKPVAETTISTSNLSANQRVNRLEQQVNNINQQNLISKIDELQQRVQKLNGQVEDQAHQIEQFNIQLRNFYQDLNKRLDKPLEKSATADVLGTQDSNVTPVTTGEIVEATPILSDKPKPSTDKDFLKEQQMYQTALDLLPDKKYQESGNKLRDYLKTYPKGVYVANVHYWLGEINFLQKNYDVAEEEFNTVVKKYSKSKRISDAMFKLALVHQNQGREVQAKNELKQVVKRYPNTSAAQLAKAQLEGN